MPVAQLFSAAVAAATHGGAKDRISVVGPFAHKLDSTLSCYHAIEQLCNATTTQAVAAATELNCSVKGYPGLSSCPTDPTRSGALRHAWRCRRYL